MCEQECFFSRRPSKFYYLRYFAPSVDVRRTTYLCCAEKQQSNASTHTHEHSAAPKVPMQEKFTPKSTAAATYPPLVRCYHSYLKLNVQVFNTPHAIAMTPVSPWPSSHGERERAAAAAHSPFIAYTLYMAFQSYAIRRACRQYTYP